MKQVIVTISLILLTCSVCVSLANTNTTSQPLPSSASDQPQTINKEEPIDGHLYEFCYTFDFARKFGFGRIVELLEEEQYAKALRELRIKTSSGFSWNKEAISGYQYGFFAEALKGICLEKMDEVVKAYRAYQNARYYCDEEKVSTLGTQFPAPKLEVYVGIGRMCNEAGRWTDSLLYLDAARMEAAEYQCVAVAADRGLIERAEDLGELEELLLLFEDLKSFEVMKKSDYRTYADTLFRIRKDRRGFDVVLEGITKYGINNVLGTKDQLVKLFLDNFVRTIDDEVILFYGVLGDELQKAKLEKGNEFYIAELINIREMFASVFDFLEQEDDLQKIKERITKMKFEQKQKQISKESKLIKKLKKRQKRIRPSQNDYDTLSNIQNIEDFVMAADYDYKMKNYLKAFNKYKRLLSNMTSGVESDVYDDTTIKRAVEVGYYGCKVSIDRNICDIPIELKEYIYRDNILGILLYSRSTNDILCNKYQNNLSESSKVKLSNPILKSGILKTIIEKLERKGSYRAIIILGNNMVDLDASNYRIICDGVSKAYLALAECEKAAEIILNTKKYTDYINNWYMYVGWLSATQQYMIIDIEIKRNLVGSLNLNLSDGEYFKLLKYLDSKELIDKFNMVNEYIENKQYKKAERIVYDYAEFYGHICSINHILANLYICSGNYEAAISNVKDGVKYRKFLVFSGNDRSLNQYKVPLTSFEKEVVDSCKKHINSKELKWLVEYQRQ